jgi:hypothetical protein
VRERLLVLASVEIAFHLVPLASDERLGQEFDVGPELCLGTANLDLKKEVKQLLDNYYESRL